MLIQKASLVLITRPQSITQLYFKSLKVMNSVHFLMYTFSLYLKRTYLLIASRLGNNSLCCLFLASLRIVNSTKTFRTRLSGSSVSTHAALQRCNNARNYIMHKAKPSA